MNKDNIYPLNLPPFDAKIMTSEQGTVIFDILRRKYVALTPEEWVRQHFVHYLISEKNYPSSLLANEASIKIYSMKRRCDTVVYNNKLEPLMLLEYKSPNIKISQQVFDQIARYNLIFRVNYLVVSNGLSHYCCKVDFDHQSYHYLSEIPDYTLLNENQ